MKIYTRTGDKGDTALYGGKRLSKAHIKIEAYGTVDELNATIGLLIANLLTEKKNKKIASQLATIQSRLFDIGTHLAAVTNKKNLLLPELKDTAIIELELQIDDWQNQLPELKYFILPSGTIAAAQAHVARTVCRRAERCIVALSSTERVHPYIIQYINRLSDYLFVLARYLNYKAKVTETIWKAH